MPHGGPVARVDADRHGIFQFEGHGCGEHSASSRKSRIDRAGRNKGEPEMGGAVQVKNNAMRGYVLVLGPPHQPVDLLCCLHVGHVAEDAVLQHGIGKRM